MSSTTSFADCLDTARLDPTKHVNFVQGMVLGVDDFRQEFAWHAGRHEMIARDLAGYGTISGLRVAVDDNGTAAPIVAVDPGLAVTPTGRFVRIKRRQCANLAQWLARSENSALVAGLAETLGSPGMRAVRVYVRLRYAECLTDDVPIPGEPCRTEEEAMAASRIADSWRLHLSFDAPQQHEEDAVRELVRWLRLIPIVEHPAAAPREVADALRAAAPGPFPIELVLADPPADLVIGRDDLCSCLRAALRVWVTELRHRVQQLPEQGEAGCGCAGDTAAASSPPAAPGPGDDLLLAELWVPVTGANQLDTTGAPPPEIEIEETQRPCLLHLRLLQELVTCGPDAAEAVVVGSFASVLATAADALLLWVHHPVEIDLPAAGALGVEVNDVASEFAVSPLGGVPNVFELRFTGSPPLALHHGDRVALAFDLALVIEQPSGRTLRDALDQTRGQYLDHAGDAITVRTIVGFIALDDLIDVDAGGAANADVLTFRDGRWRPEAVVIPPHTHLLDDLDDVTAPGPNAGQVLTFRGSQWRPEATQLPSHTHALGELSDVQVGGAGNGQFLRFDGTNWVPANVTGGAATPVHSGVAVFARFPAGGSGWFGPFDHGLGDRLVMIRLALELGGDLQFQAAENTDTIANSTLPRAIAGYEPSAPSFAIFLQDVRSPNAQPVTYRIRWFAIPVTERFPDTDARPLDIRLPDFKVISRGIILTEVAAGNNRVSSIASRLGTNAAGLQPILDGLRADNLIRITRGVISLGG